MQQTEIKLSSKQQKIVDIIDGAIYVKASAGSGKTRVLTERIKCLLESTNKKILALTFTNKAAEEIKNRLQYVDNLGEHAFIGTFHSFCQYILENHGYAIRLSPMPHIFENDSDRLILLEQAILDIPMLKEKYLNFSASEQRNYCFKVLDYFSQVKRGQSGATHEDMVLLYENYQDILLSQNAIDFDDLIRYSSQLLSENLKIASLYQRMYQYICIDEAQDLNCAQYEFLKIFAGDAHNNVMLVGDPKQSIFAFNGSDPKYMDELFVKDFQPIVEELTENYRSAKEILKAANKIISVFNDVDNDNMLINTKKCGEFSIYKAENPQQEAEYVLYKIQELMQKKIHEDIEGEVNYERMAVLARNRYVFSDLEDVFKNKGIPFNYKIPLGPIKFQSTVFRVFDLAFRVRLNPKDKLHWSELIKLINVEYQKTDNLNNDFAGLLSLLPDTKADKLIKNIISIVIELKEDGSNFLDQFSSLESSLSQNEHELSVDEILLIGNEIAEIKSHWQKYAKTTDTTSLQQFKNAMALGKTYSLTKQHTGVTLSTVHTMKGQEFDIVFIIGLDEGTFPDYRSVNNGGIELEQERNSLYVAFTRAKRLLYVSYPNSRNMPWGEKNPRNISRFLKNF